MVGHVGIHQDDERASRELHAVDVSRAQSQLTGSRLQHLGRIVSDRVP